MTISSQGSLNQTSAGIFTPTLWLSDVICLAAKESLGMTMGGRFDVL